MVLFLPGDKIKDLVSLQNNGVNFVITAITQKELNDTHTQEETFSMKFLFQTSTSRDRKGCEMLNKTKHNKTKQSFYKKNFYCLFIFETERESVREGGTERERDTESEAGSRLRAVSIEPDAGLEPTSGEIMT